MRAKSKIRRAALWTLMLVGSALPAVAQAPPAAIPSSAGTATSARTWVGREQEIEDFLRQADVISMEDISVGVTKPKRAQLAPGGPVTTIAWKPIKPGMYGGFWESYRSEIAAYELDKLLDLGMIPPTVEKRVKGNLGAAIMWASPTKSFKELGGPPSAPPVHFERWNRQLIRAKMFDNLIFNKDPNLGNWLVDPAWNLILIDHTRAFTTGKNMVHTMQRIDAELWDRMKALNEETLSAALASWLGKSEIRAILARRDKMGDVIAEMVAKQGDIAVFVR